jgi:hypothetical protein
MSCIERNAVLIINEPISLAAAVLTHPELIWWVVAYEVLNTLNSRHQEL